MTQVLVDALRRAGLCAPGEDPPVKAMSGGVSSDIWRVDLRSGPVCVKRALARLRVEQLWEAPVVRNRYERLWLEAAAACCPGAVPKVLAWQDELGLFAMEYLERPVWKALLREGRAQRGFAAQVGRALGAIHSGTAARAEIAETFATDAIFHAIRLEPYLLATAEKHPGLRKRLVDLAARTARTKMCLVHGDVSPKNILVGSAGPIFLDAECAWYGDPAFDLAFCLNHLLLKCLWVPGARNAFLECFDALAHAYLAQVRFAGIEERTASLLPALLLARVDGKSPVEYLDAHAKEHVRRFSRSHLVDPRLDSLSQLRAAWQESLT